MSSRRHISQIGITLISSLLLSSCGGSSGSSSNTNATNGVVSIDAMTTVPVINGSATKGTLYIHNYSNSAATGLNFGLGKATTASKFQSLLSKLGLNSSSTVSKDGFTLINPELCSSIPAGGSCAINFTTPGLSAGDKGSSLVSLSYKLANGEHATNQIVNYQYTSLNALSGVNFTGGLTVAGAQGSTQHVVGYVYAGGEVGNKYTGVNLRPSALNTQISNGFINGQEMVAGQVIPVEFAVTLQNNKPSAVNVVPEWGNVKQVQKHTVLGGSLNTGALLTLNLTPSQNTVNYIFGTVPVLVAPATTPATITVTNNGNADAAGGLTATSDNPVLQISGSCTSTALLANAANTCNFNFSESSYTPGTATVTFKDSNSTTVATQTVIWTNNRPVPAVYITPSASNISFAKYSTESGIVFTVNNVGNAPLNSTTFPTTNTGPATWVQDGTTCSTSVAPGAQCTISGHFVGSDDGDGIFYISANGSYNSTNYSFVSLPITYQVTAAPSLSITPIGVSMTLIANGEDLRFQTFTVTNQGSDNALFTTLNLTESNTTIKPVIESGGTCTGTTNLAESQSCTVVIKYGPAAATNTTNESGIGMISIDYHGGEPDTPRNVQNTFNYNLIGNDSGLIESVSATNLTGSGTSGAPYSGNPMLNPMKITLTYTNQSSNYPESNLNFNTNNLPYGLVVESASSTCPTGANTMNLGINQSCTLTFVLDRSRLATSPSGGSVVLNFTTPTATWTTPMGFYSQAGSMVYVNYLQPTVVSTLSQNESGFESTTLSMQAANESMATSITFKVDGVSAWLESVPVNPSSNCTVNPTTYAVSCDLKTTSLGQVTYIMPTYLQQGESADIPLLFSVAVGEYAYLNPSYTFIGYIIPPPAWLNVGSAGFSAGQVSYISLAFNESTNQPYVAYKDGGNSSKATVMYYDGSSWQPVGSAGFSAGQSDYISLAFNPVTNQPYVAYKDGGNSNKATVMYYDGSSWQPVGSAGFSADEASYISLAFNESTNQPYVAYRDEAITGGKATVMYYNGSSWQTVGSAGFSAYGASQISLAFNPATNQPYVAYRDSANGGKTTVMYYNGSSWQTVGSVGFSAGQASYISLAFNESTNQPYVAYRDGGASSKATVMYYNDSSWQTVGSAGFSAGQSDYISLAFNPANNKPYVAYQDFGNNAKATVMYYNGSSWQIVGSAGLSAGAVVYTSLAFNPATNYPYLAYMDAANGSKATVMNFPYSTADY